MDGELWLRLGVFVGLFLALAGLERLRPRRRLVERRGRRWPTTLGITVINTALLRSLAVALPLLAIGAAIDARAQGWGLFNRLDWPEGVEIVLAVLIFDLCIWAQHLITHKVPLFWRFHRVHHADRDFDVTTAVRFHPVEIAASMLLKIGLVYALGPAPVAVLAFEVLLSATALFTHANLALPQALDRTLRRVLVTPDMHRIHHSVHRHEHDSNYGFALSIWDRIFGTYRATPDSGHDGMTVGLEWQDERPARLGWSLMLPFRR